MQKCPISNFLLGFDLARDHDHSAIATMALRQVHDGPFDRVQYVQPVRPILELGGLDRLPLGMRYLDVVQYLRQIITRLKSSHPFGHREPPIWLVLDAAGPGQVVRELIRDQHLGVNVVPLLLSGGLEPGISPSGTATVPRRQLVNNLRLMLELETLRIHRGLRFGPFLEKEISSIRPDAGQYEHDDLAIAAALAAWHATRIAPGLRTAATAC